MKALVADGVWAPRPGYAPGREEEERHRALVGSQVWRNTSFDIKEIPAPRPLEDEVLIRVKSCGVCGSDTHVYETDKDGYIIFSGLTKLPCVIGHEFSGVVEETGRLVKGLKKGDIVAVESVMWCGICTPCRSGHPNQCRNVELLGLSRDGALAELVAVNERYCWKIDPLSEVYEGGELFDIGALIEPVGCAYNGMFVVAGGFKPGSTVVVYGAGPIGLGAVSLARAAGADMVIAFDVTRGRTRIAREMGADHAFNIREIGERRPSDIVLELTKGAGAEVQVEAAGAAPKTVPEMERSLASQGRIVYLGRAATSTPMHLDALVTGANSVVGARGHAGYGIFPNIIRLIAKRRIDLSPMISQRFPFESVKEALAASADRENGKIMVGL
ncbi:MAG: alcohol dehydrogenase catalytic domain-containing protein [Deltaproteobacteria bacterium]|nr:alcohol dehydrogenase catalytic domain-containing protein [Deltaproteobacteria bacterium]